MAYDEQLAQRLRELLHGENGLSEKQMFGGLAFLINGNMSVSASGQGGLLLRVDPDEFEALLKQAHAQPFEMRGSSMQGWLRIAPEGLKTKRELERWVKHGVGYARSLPPKSGSRGAGRRTFAIPLPIRELRCGSSRKLTARRPVR